MASFSIRSSALAATAHVIGFAGRETLSRPYEFDVYFTINGAGDDFDLGDALTAKATLSIDLGGFHTPHEVHGIFASMRLLRAMEGNSLYVGRVVPQLWQLSLTRHSRIWTKRNLKEIVTEILGELGLTEGDDFEFALSSEPPLEEHISQYKESNLDFLHRWFEREGWYYFFDHTGGTEKIVFTDHKGTHTSLRTNPVRYWPQNEGDVTAKQAFDNFTCNHQVLPASVRVVDYDYAKPQLDVSHTSVVTRSGIGEIATYGARLFSKSEAQRIATLRSEDLRAKEVVYFATGAATNLVTGYCFELEQHPRAGYNRSYLITSMRHYGYQPSMALQWGSLVPKHFERVYRQELEAIESDRQYRHGQVTAWPHIEGYENAVVDGPAVSNYAQIDEQGRYAIKFKYDEGTLRDGKASTFVRMMQPHGGGAEGFHFPLRKGTEVICAFLDGDPDRPVIVGVVPNAVTPSPVASNNHTLNVLQTGGENYMVMEDLDGSQFINLFCPVAATNLYMGNPRGVGGHDLNSNAAPLVPTSGPRALALGPFAFDLRTDGSGQIHTVGNLNIDADATLQVMSGPQTTIYYGGILHRDVQGVADEHFHSTMKYVVDDHTDREFRNGRKTQVLAALADDLYAVGHKLVINAGQTVTINDGQEVTINAGRTQTINAGSEETINGGREITVTGGQEETITGGETQTITGGKTETVNGDHSETINGNQTVVVNGERKVTVTAPKALWQYADSKKFQYGYDLSVFLGAKIGAHVGLKADAFIGIKLSLEASLAASFNASIKLEGTAGGKLEWQGGFKFKFKPLNAQKDTMNITMNVLMVRQTSISIRMSALHLIL